LAVTLDEAGLGLLKQFEGYRFTSYQDTAGVWTIGYGHTDGVVEGMTISQAQADQLLLADTRHTVSITTTLLAGVGVVLRQHRAENYPAMPLVGNHARGTILFQLGELGRIDEGNRFSGGEWIRTLGTNF
jgi:lysozyme